MDRQKAAAGFALLADPNRLEILRLLSQGEKNATELLKGLPVSQPTLSHHMRLLCQGGLVTQQRQGQRVLYTLCRAALRELLSPKPPSLKNYTQKRKSPPLTGNKEYGILISS